MKKKIPQLDVEKRLSSRLSYWLLVTFLPKNQRLSLATKFNSPSVYDEKKKSLQWSAFQTETSVNFRLENSLLNLEWQSQTASSLLMAIM